MKRKADRCTSLTDRDGQLANEKYVRAKTTRKRKEKVGWKKKERTEFHKRNAI